MSVPLRLSIVSCIFGALLALSGCENTGGNTELVVPPAQSNACTEHSACGAGHLCANGVCTPGDCWPEFTREQCSAEENAESIKPYCCKAWQVCGELYQCAPDPESPIGAQCETDDECPNPGEFCSAGSCYAPSGRTACTTTAQCGADERCDLEAFLCVPDRGGCTYCDDYPEVCCEDGWVCDPETTRCIEQGDQECTPETEATDCRAGQKCHQGRCVQCITNDDCGPGTECSEATGQCYSVLNHCESDEDCREGLKCSLVNNECVMPECSDDSECRDWPYDSRYVCDANIFSCVLPGPICDTEADEPNETIGNARPVENGAYSSMICRGDVDMISFGVQSDKRYRVDISFTETSDAEDIELALLDANGAEIDNGDVSYYGEGDVSGSYYGSEAATWYLRINANITDADQWNYTVTVTETDAPPPVECVDSDTTDDVDVSDAQYEPNNTLADAYEITVGTEPQIFSFARCSNLTGEACSYSCTSEQEDCTGEGQCMVLDIDWYKLILPPQTGVEVTTEFDDGEGNLDLYLCTSEDCDYTTSSGNVDKSAGWDSSTERVTAGEGYDVLYVKNILYMSWSGEDALEQSYIMTIKPIGRPAECSADIGEPDDDDAEGAQALTMDQTLERIRCLTNDADHFSVTVPADHTGVVELTFNHQSEGNLKLELLDSTGEVEATSDSSGYSSGSEVLEILPDGSAQTRIVRVSLSSTFSADDSQTYTISASSYDSSACVASEPDSNNVKVDATSIKPSDSFTGLLQACAYDDGNGGTSNDCHMCGHSDEDWYHLGKLYADQSIVATLSHDTSLGVLGMELRRSSSTASNTASTIEINPNSQSANEITVDHTESATLQSGNEYDYYVKVYAEGTEGHEAQPYQLTVDFSAACLPDANEGEFLNNSIMSATIGRDTTTEEIAIEVPAIGTLCTGDKDYFKFFVDDPGGENETITLTPGSDNIDIILVDENDETLAEAASNDGGVSDGVVSYTHPGGVTKYVYAKITKKLNASSFEYSFSVTIE